MDVAEGGQRKRGQPGDRATYVKRAREQLIIDRYRVFPDMQQDREIPDE